MNLSKIKLILLPIIFLTLQINLKGQIILLHEDVKSDTVESRYGPNRTHYIQMFYGAGFIFGQPDTAGADIKKWKSYYLTAGLRYKLKLGKNYAVGLDVYYQFNSYRMKQSLDNFLPDTIIHKKEKMNFNNVSAAFFNRINFKKRGDVIGNFFDFGVYADYVFGSTHYYRDVDASGSTSQETAVRKHNLSYVNDYNYGAFLRIGWEGFAFWGEYRFSDMFDKNYSVKYPELPRLYIGIEISSY